MNTDIKEEFYEFLSQNKALQTIQSIVELSNNLPGYRAEKFFNSLKGHTPFKKNYRYRANHWLFENFKLGSNTFKIDVIFFENGNASILLWNPGKAEDVQKTTTQKILTDVGMLDEFSIGGFGGGMKKDFEISKFSDNIVELDKSLLDVFQRLLAELSKIKE